MVRYEIGLVRFYDSPATEKRGPFNTREECREALKKANKELGKTITPYTIPQWMWAREGEIPLKRST